MKSEKQVCMLSRTYKGNVILCRSCKTKQYRVFIGKPKERWGYVEVHKKGCKKLKKLLESGIEI